jgi:phage-related protein (TIGR01555 family)
MAEVVQILDATATPTVDSYENFLARVGVVNNNVLSAGYYGFNLLTRNRIQLEAAYRGSWIVGQMINAVAEDMTKAGVNVSTGEQQFDLKRLNREIRRRGIANSLCSAIAWGRLYGGGLAVLNIAGQDMETPLDPATVAKGQFKGLLVYDRWQLTPDLVNVIKSGPEMGLPAYYEVTTGWTSDVADNPMPTSSLRIHHSRCIRMIGIPLPYFQAITEMMWGESELERLWDRLLSFDNTTLSTANLVERANNRTVKVDKLRSIIAAGGAAQKGLEKQFEMMREFQTNEGLTLMDKEDEFHVDVYTFSGLDAVLLQFGQQLAGACGIPLVRLFGQSPSGLSSTGESDLRTYYDNINAKQNLNLTNPWERIMSVLWPSTYGKPMPEDVEITFVPLWQMSELDRAQINQINTQTVIAAQEAGLVKRSTAMRDLRNLGGDGGLFGNLTDEEIDEAESSDDPPIPDLVKPTPDPLAEGPEAEAAELQASPKKKLSDSIDRIKAWLSRSR